MLEKRNPSSASILQHGVQKRTNRVQFKCDLRKDQLLLRQAMHLNSVKTATSSLGQPGAITMAINEEGKTFPVIVPQQTEIQAAASGSGQLGAMTMVINEEGKVFPVIVPQQTETQAAATDLYQAEAMAVVINEKNKAILVKLPQGREFQAAATKDQTGTATGSMVQKENALGKTVPVKLPKKTKRICKHLQSSGNSQTTCVVGSGCRQEGNPYGEILSSSSSFTRLPARNPSADIAASCSASNRLQGPTLGTNYVPAPVTPRGFYRPTPYGGYITPTTKSHIFLYVPGPLPFRFVSPTTIGLPLRYNFTPSYSMPTEYSGPDPFDLPNSTALPGNLPSDNVVFDSSMSTECLEVNPPNPLNPNTIPEFESSVKNLPSASASSEITDFPTTPFDMETLKNAMLTVEKPVAPPSSFFPLNLPTRPNANNDLAAMGEQANANL